MFEGARAAAPRGEPPRGSTPEHDPPCRTPSGPRARPGGTSGRAAPDGRTVPARRWEQTSLRGLAAARPGSGPTGSTSPTRSGGGPRPVSRSCERLPRVTLHGEAAAKGDVGADAPGGSGRARADRRRAPRPAGPGPAGGRKTVALAVGPCHGDDGAPRRSEAQARAASPPETAAPSAFPTRRLPDSSARRSAAPDGGTPTAPARAGHDPGRSSAARPGRPRPRSSAREAHQVTDASSAGDFTPQGRRGTVSCVRAAASLRATRAGRRRSRDRRSQRSRRGLASAAAQAAVPPAARHRRSDTRSPARSRGTPTMCSAAVALDHLLGREARRVEPPPRGPGRCRRPGSRRGDPRSGAGPFRTAAAATVSSSRGRPSPVQVTRTVRWPGTTSTSSVRPVSARATRRRRRCRAVRSAAPRSPAGRIVTFMRRPAARPRPR